MRIFHRKTDPHDGDVMKAARRAVLAGRTIRDAALEFGIPKSTLHRYVHKAEDHIPKKITSGRFRTVFSEEQEEELVRFIIDMSIRFYGMTRKVLTQKAFLLAEANGIPHPFKNGQAGYDWSFGFLKRHKDRLSMRTAQPLCIQRIHGFTRTSVYHFFDNLESIVTEKGYRAHQVFNADETGMTVVVSRAPRVIAQRGSRIVAVVKAKERGNLVTVVACASASGRFIPPFFVFRGNRARLQEEKVQLGPEGSESGNSPKGWMVAEVFLEWLHHFKRHAEPSENKKILLILDNHSSHVTVEAVEFARENHMDILTLPPHTSHRLQPLDVGLFSPLRAKYNEALLQWQMNHRYEKPTELDIPAILRRPYEEAARPQTAINAFRKTGIWVPYVNGPDRNVFYPDEFVAEESAAQPAAQSSNQSRRDGSGPRGGAGGSAAAMEAQGSASAMNAQGSTGAVNFPEPASAVGVPGSASVLDASGEEAVYEDMGEASGQVELQPTENPQVYLLVSVENAETGIPALRSLQDDSVGEENLLNLGTEDSQNLPTEPQHSTTTMPADEVQEVLEDEESCDDTDSGSSVRRASGSSIASDELMQMPVVPPPPEFDDCPRSDLPCAAASALPSCSKFAVQPSQLFPSEPPKAPPASSRQMSSTLVTSERLVADKREKQRLKVQKEEDKQRRARE